MTKKKTLEKQELILKDIPRIKMKHEELEEVKPSDFFRDPSKIALALFQALIENDTNAFLEILDTYLDINRTQVAKKSLLARSTIQQIFSKGNPTLKTIAKVMHTAVDKPTQEWFKQQTYTPTQSKVVVPIRNVQANVRYASSEKGNKKSL